MNLFRFCYNGPVSLADAQGLLCDSLWRSLGNAAGSMFTGDTQADPNSYIAQRTADLGPTENIVPGIVSDAVTAAGSAATAAAAGYLGGRLAGMAAEALGLDDLLASALGEAEGGDAGAGVGEDLGAGDACSAAETTAGQTYQIMDGVRRATAANLTGATTIDAEILDANMVSQGVQQVPINSLLSPKEFIDLSGSGAYRWNRVLEGTQSGATLPPIQITPGSIGTPIRNVTIGQP